jgi:hypothetical protein
MPLATALLPVLGLASFFGLDTPKFSRAVESAVVIIRTPDGGGSGFLVELDGKKYIVTNQHVLMGVAAANVHITFIDGTEAHPTAPEIIGNLDLARIRLDTDRTPLKSTDAIPEIGTRVFAVGNSLDAGVITIGAGSVKGVGPQEVEVDCDFVPGNSGGPILNGAENVIGVATYIRLGEITAATGDTRYVKNRRFAIRLRNGMPWTPVPQWQVYAGIGAMIHNAQSLADEVLIAAQGIAAGADLSLFKPRTQKVISAIGDLNRLRAQFSKLKASGLTPQKLQSSRAALVATYRSAFLKLRDACSASVRELNARPIPPAWGWLNNERTTTVKQLEMIQAVLESEIKADPPF